MFSYATLMSTGGGKKGTVGKQKKPVGSSGGRGKAEGSAKRGQSTRGGGDVASRGARKNTGAVENAVDNGEWMQSLSVWNHEGC